MKASIIALAAAVGIVSAETASVLNKCAGFVYVQSFPYDGSTPGPLTALHSGQEYSEPYRRSGTTIKISKFRNLASPLFFGYSFGKDSGTDVAYYEFSTKYGNPFAANHNSLSAGDGCQSFDCAANDKDCYSTSGTQKIYNCPEPVDLNAVLCA